MHDPAFRRSQRGGRYEPHVAPVNRFVDELSAEGRGWVPHVAPVHGGTGARLLWVMRDPGPATADPERDAAGFLCVENDDPTAERLGLLLDRAGIDLADTMPWNAYPWYVNRPPDTAELRAGAAVLGRLLALLPALEVVLLFGRHAQRCWALLAAADPAAVAAVQVLATRHPSRQAFIGSAEERAAWREEQALVVDRVGALLAGTSR